MSHRPVEITASNLGFTEHNRDTDYKHPAAKLPLLCQNFWLKPFLGSKGKYNAAPTPSTPCKTKSLQSPGENTGHSSAEQGAQVTTTWWPPIPIPHPVLDTDKHSQPCKVHAVHSLFPLNCIQAPKLLWQTTVVEKWCILHSQPQHIPWVSTGTGKAQFPCMPGAWNHQNPASSAGIPASTKQGLAWSPVNQTQRQHWCLRAAVWLQEAAIPGHITVWWDAWGSLTAGLWWHLRHPEAGVHLLLVLR